MPNKALKQVINLFEKGLGFTLFVDKRYWFLEAEYGYLGYAKRETNSVVAGINALAFAFTNQWDDLNISVELIENIHKIVTEEVNPNPILAEQYKRRYGQTKYKEKGLDEVESIKQGVRSTPVFFRLNSTVFDDISELEVDLTSLRENDVKLYCLETDELEDDLINASSIEDYKAKFQKYYSEAPVYTSDCASMPFNAYVYVLPPILTEAEIKVRLDLICDRYNKQILLAQTEEDKLNLIFKTVKDIELIHPFSDGNIRVSVVLLQRLLLQNNLMPTAMMDPNHLDHFTVTHLVKNYLSQEGALALTRLLIRQDQAFTTEDIKREYNQLFKFNDDKVVKVFQQICQYNQRSEEISTQLKDFHFNKQDPKAIFSSRGKTLDQSKESSTINF